MAHAPGSLTTWAPRSRAGWKAQNTAPAGSARTARRPASPRSNGSASTLPPALAARAAVSSALPTQMWVPQAGTAGASPPRPEPTAATSRPRRVQT
jgi:hypothetical protein